MQLTTETLSKIELATRKEFPKEMCGVILHDGSFLQLQNISNKPETSFELDPLKYYEIEKEVAFIIHSHTGINKYHPITPSLADITLAEATKKDLFICAIRQGRYYPPIQIPPEPNSNYLGRPYIFGVSDCGILARDYLFFELGIEWKMLFTANLTAFAQWSKAVRDTFELNELQHVFIDISKSGSLKKGDLLLTSVYGGFENHAMIWTGEAVLNQGEFSKLEPLELHLSKITKVFRHPSLME